MVYSVLHAFLQSKRGREEMARQCHCILLRQSRLQLASTFEKTYCIQGNRYISPFAWLGTSYKQSLTSDFSGRCESEGIRLSSRQNQAVRPLGQVLVENVLGRHPFNHLLLPFSGPRTCFVWGWVYRLVSFLILIWFYSTSIEPKWPSHLLSKRVRVPLKCFQYPEYMLVGCYHVFSSVHLSFYVDILLANCWSTWS